MAISFVNMGTWAAGTTSIAPGIPASMQAGDLMLAVVHTCNQAVTQPTGWTQVTNSPVSTGTANTAGGTRLTVYYRWWQSGDSAPTISVTGGTVTNGRIFGYSGVDPSTPFDATPVANTIATASTTLTWSSITTATADDLIFLASARDQDANSTAAVASYVNSNLSNITERWDQVVNTGVGGGICVADGFMSTIGATGNTTATQTSSIAVCLTIALKPMASITGTLSFQESGNDTFDGNGSVSWPAITGTLNYQETNNDIFDSIGNVRVLGNLNYQESAFDNFSATGNVRVLGNLSYQETDNDTFTSTGKVSVLGNLSYQETGNDVFTSTGFVSDSFISGTLNYQESNNDTFNSIGKVRVLGNLSYQEIDNDIFASTGKVKVLGNLSYQETGNDVFTSTGNVRILGNLSYQETTMDLFIGESVQNRVGTLNYKEINNDILYSTGNVKILGNLNYQEINNDTFSSIGKVRVLGNLNYQEINNDTLVSTGNIRVLGNLNYQESTNDTLISTGFAFSEILGNLSVLEIGSDTFSSNGEVFFVSAGNLFFVESGEDLIEIDGTEIKFTAGEINVITALVREMLLPDLLRIEAAINAITIDNAAVATAVRNELSEELQYLFDFLKLEGLVPGINPIVSSSGISSNTVSKYFEKLANGQIQIRRA